MFFSNKNVHKYLHPYIIKFYNYLLGKTVATLLSQEKKGEEEAFCICITKKLVFYLHL